MNRNRLPARLWQTTTFRLAVIFAAVFGLGTGGLLLVLDIAVGRFAEETARDALRDQVAVLKADADAEGGAALVRSLREHVSGGQPERFSYLVITPDGGRLNAGLPASVEQIKGLASIHLPMAEEEGGPAAGKIEVIVLTDRAKDGTFIAVGRDTYALAELRQWLHQLALWGGVTLILVALAGGVAAGALLLRRLKSISDAAERVVSGDLSERLPSLGIGREFDDLADTLNTMLDRLQAAMEALRQVSSDVAHDLRTPLTRLRNTLEDAQRADAGARTSLITEAVGETDRLLEIFAALLRLAQIEGGASRRFAEVNLATLAADVVDAYQPAADQAGWSLNLPVIDDALVQGDATMLAQVIASLIDNALTHGASGRAIEVSVRRRGSEAEICVADDGPGAPEAELRHLTRRFYRLDQSRHTDGSGLGLSMVAAIATLHGGVLMIANRNPGLAVTLRLPFTDVQPASLSPSSSLLPEITMSHPIRAAALTLAGLFLATPGGAAPAGLGYHVVARLAGPDGGWDYASYDPHGARVIVARSASIDLYDPASAATSAAFAPAARGHAALAVNDGREILITNGSNATATFVDSATGAAIASVATGDAPDAAVFDAQSGLVLVMDHRGGDVVLIDPKTHSDQGRVTVGGALEAAAVDGRGHAFVNVEDQNVIAVIDIVRHKVTARYALTGCEGPTGLAYAAGEDLLIASCDGVAEIVRASTGEVVRSITMGGGADGVAYDEVRKLAFVPAGETGELAVLRIAHGDATLIDTIPTARGARTIAVDSATGLVFLPSADYAPAVDGHRPAMIPGSFRLLVVGPAA